VEQHITHNEFERGEFHIEVELRVRVGKGMERSKKNYLTGQCQSRASIERRAEAQLTHQSDDSSSFPEAIKRVIRKGDIKQT